MKRDTFLPYWLVLAVAVAAGSACYTGPNIGAAAGPSPTAVVSETEPAGATGLPCDVAVLIENHCATCHSSSPRSGAKTTLTTREALLATFEGRPIGELVVERMRDSVSPMPPSGLLPEPDVKTLQTWVEAGMPEGTCGQVSSDTVPPIQVTCTSGRFWTEDEDEGDKLMSPGRACITCHTKENGGGKRKSDDDEERDGDEDAPAFTFAGTVYPTLHEPDDCFGLADTTKIVVEGADGKKLTLAVNKAGNFMTELPLALPYRASVVRGGAVRTMKTAQTNGDCNVCHTALGGDAPGRLVAP